MVPIRRLAILVAAPFLFIPCGISGKATSRSQTDERACAIQALNRLTFGPRPGDVDRVLAMGVDKWIDRQLHPDAIDDHELEARLAPLRTLRMSPRELAENFPPQPVIRQIADGKQALPRDPERRAIYQAQLVRFREKQEKKAGEVDQNDMAMRAPEVPSDEQKSQLLASLPDQRMNALFSLTAEEQVNFISGLKGSERDRFLAGLSPAQRETVMALNNPQQAVTDELLEGKILRATYSERQLEQVMTDFWFNHFNVFIGKGADRYQLTSYEHDVIRPHALGKFEDLLLATAESPAMLFYLDNWLSVGPNSDFALGIRPHPRAKHAYKLPPRNPQAKRRSGLNENYGRELMELHTLGVNGGYSQKDVTEAARILTGWTIKEPREGGGFTFDERKHEPGTKIVLGHKFKENGQKEGFQLLHLLAHHPSTAKFISTKLAMRFVSDNPPPALIESMAKTFLKKDGDIREVLKTMLASQQFWAADSYRAKVKTPLEFVVSALRASGAEITDTTPIARQLQGLGMPLYGAQPPTGYSMKAATWVSSSALLGRMNFAIRLASGKIPGVQMPALAPGNAAEDAHQALRSLENSLLAGDVSQETHATISARLEDPSISRRRLDDPARSPDVALIEGLLLGSPEFQRR